MTIRLRDLPRELLAMAIDAAGIHNRRDFHRIDDLGMALWDIKRTCIANPDNPLSEEILTLALKPFEGSHFGESYLDRPFPGAKENDQ